MIEKHVLAAAAVIAGGVTFGLTDSYLLALAAVPLISSVLLLISTLLD